MKKKIGISIAIATVIVIMVTVAVVNQSKHTAAGTAVVTAEKEKVADNVMVPGTVVLTKRQAIYHSPESGKIKDIYVEPGQVVKEGQGLLQYEQPQLSQELKQGKLALESADLRIKQAKERISSLKEQEKELADKLGKDKAEKELEVEMDGLQMELELAEIERKQAELQTESIEKKIEELKVLSEFEGTVISVDEQVGGNMAEPLLVIGQMATMAVEGTVTEYDSIKIKEGQKVKLKSDSITDEEWNGQVLSISMMPDELQTGMEDAAAQYPVTVRLEGNIDRLRPGYELIMEIITDERNVISVPLEAVQSEGDKQYIYKIVNRRAERMEVKTGIVSGDRIEILKGIKENEEVIANPGDEITDGMEVTVE